MTIASVEKEALAFFAHQRTWMDENRVTDTASRMIAAYERKEIIGAAIDDGELPVVLRKYARNCQDEFRDTVGQNEYLFATASGTGSLYGDYQGQLCIPYTHHIKLDPRLAYVGAQLTGDCFVAGTEVAEVTSLGVRQTPIERIRVGDSVVTAKGNHKRVTATFAKRYVGDIVKLRGVDGRFVLCTPDHQFLTELLERRTARSNNVGQAWTPAGDLRVNDQRWIISGGEQRKVDVWQRTGTHTTTVYCIEVEDDHSFISNGYAVHNCVSWAKRSARDHARSFDIGASDANYDYVKRSATADLYSMRGHTGAGASPSRIALAATKIGILLEGPVTAPDGKVWDFSDYKSYYRIGMEYGRTGLPSWIFDINRDKGPKQVAVIKTEEELLRALWNGCGVSVGSMIGVSKTGGKDGVPFLSGLSGSWAHDMAICGMDDRKKYHRETLIIWDQSWGAWQSPELVRAWPADYGPRPEGAFVLTLSDTMKAIRGGECHALSDSVGFRPRRQATMGAEGLI